ncbi:MAG TPA: hypothetical protein VG637_06655 [Actinomycetes bacterium]|nr:hypothetical protein [Actinomycetes bacterium]
MHPLLLEELAAARIDELRREAARARVAHLVARPSRVAGTARRWRHAFGYLLVGAGLRLATAGERQGHAGRSAG